MTKEEGVGHEESINQMTAARCPGAIVAGACLQFPQLTLHRTRGVRPITAGEGAVNGGPRNPAARNHRQLLQGAVVAARLLPLPQMPPIIREDRWIPLTQGGKVSRPLLIATTLPLPLRLRNQIRLDRLSSLLFRPRHRRLCRGKEEKGVYLKIFLLRVEHNSRCPLLLRGEKEANPGQG